MARGHRKIALISWELSKAGGHEVLIGYRDALAAYGIEHNDNYVVELPTQPLDDGQALVLGPIPVDLVRRHCDRWLRQGVPPTALIHGAASETQARDLLEHCLDNRIRPDAVVGHLYRDQLRTGYTGVGEATALGVSFESLARRALELLFRERGEGEPPIREIQDKIHLCRRENGVWRETAP